MTTDEWAEYMLRIAESEDAMLDRIEYHRRKLIAEGRKPTTSEEWIAFHRRRLERVLGTRRTR